MLKYLVAAALSFPAVTAKADFAYVGTYDEFDQKLTWAIQGSSVDQQWKIEWGNTPQYSDDSVNAISVSLRPPRFQNPLCYNGVLLPDQTTVQWFRVDSSGKRGPTMTTVFQKIGLTDGTSFLSSDVPEANALVSALIDGGSIHVRYSAENCGKLDGEFSLKGVSEAIDRLHAEKSRH